VQSVVRERSCYFRYALDAAIAARAKLAGRSGQVTGLALDDNPENCIDKTNEILSLCHRLEKLTPEIGSWRVESSEYYIRAQNNIVELVAGRCAEQILHSDLSSLQQLSLKDRLGTGDMERRQFPARDRHGTVAAIKK
jgi:hypothetical protein